MNTDARPSDFVVCSRWTMIVDVPTPRPTTIENMIETTLIAGRRTPTCWTIPPDPKSTGAIADVFPAALAMSQT